MMEWSFSNQPTGRARVLARRERVPSLWTYSNPRSDNRARPPEKADREDAIPPLNGILKAILRNY
jgi:hypothetical protein